MSRQAPIDDRQEFAVEHGCLVRRVRTIKGGSYQHRCPLEAFKAVCRFIDEQAAGGVTSGIIWNGVPEVSCTQAAVTVAFLKERGCLAVEQRRCYPTSRFFFEDALIEWYALTETAD